MDQMKQGMQEFNKHNSLSSGSSSQGSKQQGLKSAGLDSQDLLAQGGELWRSTQQQISKLPAGVPMAIGAAALYLGSRILFRRSRLLGLVAPGVMLFNAYQQMKGASGTASHNKKAA